MTDVPRPGSVEPSTTSTGPSHPHGDHAGHWVLCGVAGVVLIALTVVGWLPNPLALGFGLALLVCPLAMGAVMWILMRSTAIGTRQDKR